MKTDTLRKNIEFRRVYKKGRSVVGRHFVIYYMKNSLSSNRVGFTVSKKVGNSVVRNKVRRLLKESFRMLENKLKLGYDIVIVARVAANRTSYQTIHKEMDNLLRRLENN